jgi:aromatic-L-amino-acid decarboxylase
MTEEELETLNRTVLSALNRSGYAFLSSTRLGGRFALRLCILSHRSREEDVTGVLDRILALGGSPSAS